jgi:hypothetical protein
MAITMGSVGSALHSSFHVKGFQLECYEWYQELRALHFIHHLGNTKHNYGVLNISFIDGVFNSVKLLSPKSYSGDRQEDNHVTLPENIDARSLQRVGSSDGALGRAMLLNDISPSGSKPEPGKLPTVLVRFVLLAFGVWFWQSGSEVLMTWSGQLTILDNLALFDIGHKITQPIYDLLIKSYPFAFVWLYNVQLFSTNVVVISMMALSVFGTTTRPAVTGITTLLARALLQFCTPFLATSSQIFVPPTSSEHFSLFNTNSSASFLSPHIIVACVFLFESFWTTSFSSSRVSIPFLSSLFFVMNVVITLILRTNWTCDIIFTTSLASLFAVLSNKYSFNLDYLKSL